jgi:hypothetical protein
LGQGVKNKQRNLIERNAFGQNLLGHEEELVYKKNSEEKQKGNEEGEERIPDKVFEQGRGQCPVGQRLCLYPD